MGGDGGSIPGRDSLAKTKKVKKTAAQLTFGGSRVWDWTHCALSKEALQPPIVCDDLGVLYNKQALVEAMLSKSLPAQLSYIQKLRRDIVDCNVTMRDSVECADVNHEENGGIFQCPISGLIGNGKHAFVCLRKCGCVVSQRALKNIDGGSQCIVCGASLDENVDDYTRIPINASHDTKQRLFSRIMAQRSAAHKHKHKHKKGDKAEEKTNVSVSCDDQVDEVENGSNSIECSDVVSSKKEKKKHKKQMKKDKLKLLQQQRTENVHKNTISGHKRLLDQAEENVRKKMKTSHAFSSIFTRKQRDFNFAGGGKGL
eukprot:CAMPEP_0202690970 /NCGR_PEP_ID=MMETSP1385-20130828/5821_1 /ASSEMBLY_ACC=CAM_ASM_000861 /TAXON_ID=933848 /ORGANISM="Elphidium margaritaceum" /LENGTH=313 /DNA_ID=CAMNT_0049346311 /DNA_START=9 /DNA_END=950 /DNA_ORIENTATION=+